MTTTERTGRVARAYFDAWTSAQGADALRPLMAADFVFRGGPHLVVEGREAFLAAAGWPQGATTTMRAEGYDGEHAFHLYTASRPGAEVTIAEHLTVRDGVVVASEVVVDQAAFAAFIGAPPSGAAA